MTHTTPPTPKIHEGRNVKRFREIRGMKQEALAAELGDDWNQQKVSLLEQKETIDNDILEQVAAVLELPVSAFKTFNETQPINIVSNNTFENCAQPVAGTSNYNDCTFNSLDKMVETYENMIQLQKETIALLQRLLEGKVDR